MHLQISDLSDQNCCRIRSATKNAENLHNTVSALQASAFAHKNTQHHKQQQICKISAIQTPICKVQKSEQMAHLQSGKDLQFSAKNMLSPTLCPFPSRIRLAETERPQICIGSMECMAATSSRNLGSKRPLLSPEH